MKKFDCSGRRNTNGTDEQLCAVPDRDFDELV